MSRSSFGRFLLLALLAFVFAATSARADVYDEAWKKANAAYLGGDYEAAAAAYDQLDRQGLVSPDLYYNMGVTYFRLGNLGLSVWALERAVQLEPKDDDALFNLAQVRKLLSRRATDRIDGAERDPVWIRLVSMLTRSTQTWLFVIFYLLTFWFLFWRLRVRKDARAPWDAAAAITGVGALLTGLLLLGRVALDRIPFGIVLPEQVAVKEGADANYRTNFHVHAGLRVRLLETDEGWTRVRLANGLEGWVRAPDIGKL